jgi:hypothetical protein
MKQCAIILNGNDVVKVSNLKRKYNNIINNPRIQLLEECNSDELEEKYNYWNRTLNHKEITESENNIILHHYRNIKTDYTITSIYDKLEDLKRVTKDWEDYERID